jgi:hypothetical protein
VTVDPRLHSPDGWSSKELAEAHYQSASLQAALLDLRGRFESEDLPEDLAAELSSPEKPAALKLYRLLRERVLGLPSGSPAKEAPVEDAAGDKRAKVVLDLIMQALGEKEGE